MDYYGSLSPCALGIARILIAGLTIDSVTNFIDLDTIIIKVNIKIFCQLIFTNELTSWMNLGHSGGTTNFLQKKQSKS